MKTEAEIREFEAVVDGCIRESIADGQPDSELTDLTAMLMTLRWCLGQRDPIIESLERSPTNGLERVRQRHRHQHS